MKKLGSTRWLVLLAAVLLAVSLGAVACGSDEVQAGPEPGQRSGDRVQAQGGDAGPSGAPAQRPAVQRLKEAKERRDMQGERQKALINNVRDKMSAEDQAAFDELSASIEEQRTALQEARQQLTDTLKELRALVDKYLDLSEAAED